MGPGQTVGIMLKNRPEFMIADLAVMCLGAAPFSIYATLPVPQIVPILENAGTHVVICEEVFLPLVLGSRKAGARLKEVIVLEGGGDGTLAWRDIEASGTTHTFDLEAHVNAVAPDDLAAIVYTSGTTGPAKGVEIPHKAAMAIAFTNGKFLRSQPDHRYLSWLPTAGMAERVVSHFQPIVLGGTVYFCDDPRAAAQVLPKARPNVFFAPPRFWEKIRDAILTQWAKLPDETRAGMDLALRMHAERVRLQQIGADLPLKLVEDCAKSDAEFFAPLRTQLGFGSKDVYACSGGAGAPRVLLEFFYTIGLPLDEAYGQTESAALGTRSPREKMKMGTVGIAQPGVEVKLAEDSEILIRSPAIMRGYRKDPIATSAAIDTEGWLHTGDIGTVDSEGYFRIVDRKKEMIINSFGKNMSPANIEAALTSAGPFISQAVVIGEGRNYNVALLTMDLLYLATWCEKHGFAGTDPGQLVTDSRLVAEVESEVARANEQLARVEQIKKFHIVGGEWIPGSPELTPTMKLKRRVINEKYLAEINAMYQSGD